MSLPELDQPDDTLGRQDPFVSVTRVWASLERLRVQGFSKEYIQNISRSMDSVMMRHRRTLVDEYVQAPMDSRTSDLRRQLGLEYWSDGDLLAQNDADRRMT